MAKKSIEEMHDAKVIRWDKSSQSAKFGGFMHDAVELLKLNNKNGGTISEMEDLLVDIIKMLYRVEKKVFMPKPIDKEKAIKMGQEYLDNNIRQPEDWHDGEEETNQQ